MFKYKGSVFPMLFLCENNYFPPQAKKAGEKRTLLRHGVTCQIYPFSHATKRAIVARTREVDSALRSRRARLQASKCSKRDFLRKGAMTEQ